jgi:hypothetical protein
MRTKTAAVLASAVLLAILAAPAHATSSDFKMSCAFGFPATLISCTVEATGSSCGSSSFNSYFWVWGDGNGSQQAALHDYNSSHQYSSPPSYVTVCQSVLCADNSTAANCRTLCTLSPTTNCNSGTIVVNGTFN